MLCTTSNPTLRPDTSVTRSAVEKPDRNKKSSSSVTFMLATRSGVECPFSKILRRSFSSEMPRPSSLMVIDNIPARCRASRRSVPCFGLPP